MKLLKKLIFCAFLITGMPTIYAQIDVTINPVNALFGKYSIGVDIALSEKMSVEPTFSILSRKEGDGRYTGIPVNAFFKYYFNPNNGIDRFYGTAWLRFVSRKFKYSDTSQNFSDFTQTRFGLGFGIGYKVAANNGLIFDIGFGAGRAFVDNLSYDDENLGHEEINFGSILFAGKLAIGYRFGGK